MMRLKVQILWICIGLCLPLGAQTLHLSGTLRGEKGKDIQLYMLPMERASSEEVELSVCEGARFSGEVPVASDGFYRLYGTCSGIQWMAPLYLVEKEGTASLTLDFAEGGSPWVDGSADNKALSAFNAVYYQRGRELWTHGREMTSEQMLAFLKGYQNAADSILSVYACSEPVKSYLALWAYTVTSDGYSSLLHITGKKREAFAFTEADLLKEPSQVLDTPVALYFSSTASTVARSLPAGTLRERLMYLKQRYACEALRKRVADMLVTHYISSFHYDENYDAGLAELTDCVKEFALSDRYISDFKIRKASIKGTLFPEGIILTDTEGNKVDFSAYKGYYVYVDLWASWCGPCCREVPYLQKLEKELKNERVKFVSISIDKGTKEWKARMEALNMHGNQLINQDNKLPEALNVSGIPHFLIYDKEGRLYEYKAPRPSSGEALKQLLENLR